MSGRFHAQDAVSLCDEHGNEFGRGLINFSCDEVEKIKGLCSKTWHAQLGYAASEEVVHRENVALLAASNGEDTDDDLHLRAVTPKLNEEEAAAALAAATAQLNGAQL